MTTQDESIEVMTDPDMFSNERRVDTPHGRVFVRDVPGEDPPIVLMHGFPDDHRIYDKLLPQLSPRRAVAFDWVEDDRERAAFAAQYESLSMGPWYRCVVTLELCSGVTLRDLIEREVEGS